MGIVMNRIMYMIGELILSSDVVVVPNEDHFDETHLTTDTVSVLPDGRRRQLARPHPDSSRFSGKESQQWLLELVPVAKILPGFLANRERRLRVGGASSKVSRGKSEGKEADPSFHSAYELLCAQHKLFLSPSLAESCPYQQTIFPDGATFLSSNGQYLGFLAPFTDGGTLADQAVRVKKLLASKDQSQCKVINDVQERIRFYAACLVVWIQQILLVDKGAFVPMDLQAHHVFVDRHGQLVVSAATVTKAGVFDGPYTGLVWWQLGALLYLLFEGKPLPLAVAASASSADQHGKGVSSNGNNGYGELDRPPAFPLKFSNHVPAEAQHFINALLAPLPQRLGCELPAPVTNVKNDSSAKITTTTLASCVEASSSLSPATALSSSIPPSLVEFQQRHPGPVTVTVTVTDQQPDSARSLRPGWKVRQSPWFTADGVLGAIDWKSIEARTAKPPWAPRSQALQANPAGYWRSAKSNGRADKLASAFDGSDTWDSTTTASALSSVTINDQACDQEWKQFCDTFSCDPAQATTVVLAVEDAQDADEDTPVPEHLKAC